MSATILVVDDEPSVLEFAATALAASGYNVLRAASGMAALGVARERGGDVKLLLTDVVMPDLNGPHLADQLLRNNPSLRVLFMSGWDPDVIEHHGAMRRGFKTLSKPFTFSQLLDAVAKALE